MCVGVPLETSLMREQRSRLGPQGQLSCHAVMTGLSHPTGSSGAGMATRDTHPPRWGDRPLYPHLHIGAGAVLLREGQDLG